MIGRGTTTVICGLILGVLGGVLISPAEPPPLTAPFPEEPLWETYRGKLAPSLLAGWDDQTVFVLALSASDAGRCEDLGRQVRAFLRDVSQEGHAEFQVWVPAESDVPGVRAFLNKEVLVADGTRIVEANAMIHGDTVSTPALLIVDPDGVITGAGYLNRMRGVRVVSFTDVLHWSPERGGQLVSLPKMEEVR